MTKQGGDNKTKVQTTVGVGCNHKSGRGQEATRSRSKTNRPVEKHGKQFYTAWPKSNMAGRFSHHSDAEYNLNERLKQFTWTKSYRNRHERGYKRGIKVKQYRIKDWNKNPGQIVFITSSQHLTNWKEVIEEIERCHFNICHWKLPGTVILLLLFSNFSFTFALRHWNVFLFFIIKLLPFSPNN